MLSAHVIHSPSNPREWGVRCLESLGQAGVLVVNAPARPNLNQLRLELFDSTATPLLTWADPDDWIEPAIVPALVDAVEAGALAAVSDEHVVDMDGSLIRHGEGWGQPLSIDAVRASPLPAHHLVVFNRELLRHARPHIERFPVGVEWLLVATAASLGGLVKVPKLGYSWRLHTANSHVAWARSGQVSPIAEYIRSNVLQ